MGLETTKIVRRPAHSLERVLSCLCARPGTRTAHAWVEDPVHVNFFLEESSSVVSTEVTCARRSTKEKKIHSFVRSSIMLDLHGSPRATKNGKSQEGQSMFDERRLLLRSSHLSGLSDKKLGEKAVLPLQTLRKGSIREDKKKCQPRHEVCGVHDRRDGARCGLLKKSLEMF